VKDSEIIEIVLWMELLALLVHHVLLR